MEQKKTYKILILFLIIQWAFIQLIKKYPLFIEEYYSNGVYTSISKLFQLFFRWIPFSVGDLFYGFLLILISKSIYTTFKSKKIDLKMTLYKLGAIISILYFIFHVNWGLNYYRERVHTKLNFELEEYSNTELIAFSKKLITKLNEVHLSLTKNDTVIVNFPLSKDEIKEESYIVYDQFQTKFPQFPHSNLKVKNSLFSVPLAYMGFAGYLNPFTNEAQVNYLNPTNSYSATVCHELAHQIGIGPESEANFIGYLAAINSDNTYFQYASYLNALRYCLGEIYYEDESQFEALKPLINKGILKDIEAQRTFWESYNNWSEKYFEFFYDHFLKANNQEDGIKSYNKMVVLLINYYKTTDL